MNVQLKIKKQKMNKKKAMFLPSPPKHLCNPQYMGYSVLQSDSSVIERNCVIFIKVDRK